MTDFLDDHLGGREIIENNRSKDVTFIFNPRHPSNQLEAVNLPPSVQHLGTLDTSPATDEEKEQLKLKALKDEEENEREGPAGVQEYALQHPENLTPPNPESAKEGRKFEILVDGGIWRGSKAV
nr:hypothetical protein L204_02141 [Cryptococcus depauperatus CBS 7855]